MGNGNSSPKTAGGTPLDPWDPSQRDSKLADLLTAENLGWQDKANCKGADADLFFPERGASTRKAKAICAACQVRVECLEFALMESEKFGIWVACRSESGGASANSAPSVVPLRAEMASNRAPAREGSRSGSARN